MFIQKYLFLVGFLCSYDISAGGKALVDEIKPQDFYRTASLSPPKEISARRLSALLKKKAVVLIDLRNKAEFDSAHIRGAINVPIDLLTAERLGALVPKRDATIVVYCTNNFMPTRMVALTTLGYPSIEQLGYTQVYRLEDLWSANACRAKRETTSTRKSDAVCEALLPMERAE
jgi:hypothetical protein